MVLTTHPVSSAEVVERVYLYLYSPSGAFVACYRVTFTFIFRTYFTLSNYFTSYFLYVYIKHTFYICTPFFALKLSKIFIYNKTLNIWTYLKLYQHIIRV